MTHTLLPRSTGLHYSLRALSSCIPNLQLLDITVAYAGMSLAFTSPGELIRVFRNPTHGKRSIILHPAIDLL